MSGGRTSKGEAELQCCLMPLEVFEIEGTRIVRRSPRDLDIPCKQYPRALGQVGIYCWPNKKAVAREVVETSPFVAAKISGFGPNEKIGADLRHKCGCHTNPRLPRPYPGDSRVRTFGKVQKVEGSDDTVRDQFLVRDEREVDAVPVDRFSADLVDPAPVRLGVYHQPEWGMRAIKYAVSDIERQTIERPLSSVIQSRDANDVVINAGGAHFETKIVYRRILQGKRLGERGIGARTLAKPRQRIALELLFSNLAYFGADGEAEQMLGVDRVGTCDDRP